MSPFLTMLISLILLAQCAGCSSLGRPDRGASTGKGITGALAEGHARAALRLLEKGDWSGAIARATVAVAMDPENASLHQLLASAHHRALREGQKAHGELAEAGYRVAVNLDPSSAAAVRGLGTLYLDQQRFVAAQAALSRAVQLDDGDGPAWYSLAVSAYYAGDLRTALWAVQQATQSLPEDGGVLRGAAVIHAALGMPEAADMFAQRYRTTGPAGRDLESLRGTLQRWRRQNTRLLVAQADPAAGAAPSAEPKQGGQMPSTAPDTASSQLPAGGPAVGGAAVGESGATEAPPPGATTADDEHIHPWTPPVAQPSQAPEVGTDEAPATGNGQSQPPAGSGGAPSPNQPAQLPAVEVLARDWRDCKQHFSDYDFRDDGDVSAAGAGAYPGGSGGVSTGDDETAALRALPSPCKGLPLPRMVLVDAVILTTYEEDDSAHGVNLLDSLSIVLDASREVTRTLDNFGNWTTEVERRSGYALGQNSAGITYSLNIANAARSRVEVLARPTLVALDRKASTFFSGAEVTVPVQGINSGSLEDKQVGTSLSVTPTLIDDDTLMLSAKAARSFFAQIEPGSIEEKLVSNRNTVTASVRMRFGQSLILSGLRESETSDSHTGVPVLRDTPGLQYLFSRRVQSAREKSILIVITPRRMEQFDGILSGAHRGMAKDVPDPAFEQDRRRLQSQVTQDEWMPPNALAVLQALRASALAKDYLIQRTDLGPLRAQSSDRFEYALRDLRKLLYF